MHCLEHQDIGKERQGSSKVYNISKPQAVLFFTFTFYIVYYYTFPDWWPQE